MDNLTPPLKGGNDSARRHVVVLGADGFLGSSMTAHLAAAGHRVTAYGRQPCGPLADRAEVVSIVADLRDTWSLSTALRDADVVYHFASATHPSMFFANPSAEYHEAVQPLLVLMETAASQGVRKIVFPSSGGTIYAASDRPCTEQSPTDPRSPYAIFKLASEQLLHHAARLGQFSVDVFRICNPYGPTQRARPGQGVIAHWIDAIKRDQPIKIFGDGSARRDYVFVDDVCRLMALSLSRLDVSDTFNLGTGIGTSLNELAALVQSVAGVDHDIVHLEGRPSDIESIILSPDKLLQIATGFSFTPLAEGVRTTLARHGIGGG